MTQEELGTSADVAATATIEDTPKPVRRRRTTKKTEEASSGTTSEPTVADAPPETAAVVAGEAAPDGSAEKPKRARAVRTRKATAESMEAPAETPADVAAPSTPTNSFAADAPTSQPLPEPPATSPIQATPVQATIESPVIEKRVPARFPSRFKAAQIAEEATAKPEQPRPEGSAPTQSAQNGTSAPDAPTEIPVALEGGGETVINTGENAPAAPYNRDNREGGYNREGYLRPQRRFSGRNEYGAREDYAQQINNSADGEVAPVEFNGENGAPPVQNGENGAPIEGENGYPNQQGGEYSQEGYGRMRYRDRREMRRQQRMQERATRGEGYNNGPNGPMNNQGGTRYPMPPRRREYDLGILRGMEREEMLAAAAEYNVEELPEEKEALALAILEAQARTQGATLKQGILDSHENKAFLRCEGYLPSESDVYVSPTQIKRFNLKTGDLVLGSARAPKENERFFGLLRVEAINGFTTEEMRFRKDFEKLTPIFPEERFALETEQSNITARIIDLVSPVGKGQRGLIVAPPKAGKTTLIKNIANSITINHPEVDLFVLLIDERPEEVTDISRSVRGEVVASTFDEMPENHMRVADIVMERAKRLVEMKHDVVILLDSITRLSRASNLVVTPSGRTLSGGLDPAAMYRPKRMFGAARNIEEGGSLTILATALVDTGSRMDEMIFEEFKGTGNMDLVLDRSLFDQRIFPAIDINRSGTRRDDLLMDKEELAAVFHLRRTLAQLDNDKAVTLLIDRLKNTRTNKDFMQVVAKSARNAEVKANQ